MADDLWTWAERCVTGMVLDGAGNNISKNKGKQTSENVNKLLKM